MSVCTCTSAGGVREREFLHSLNAYTVGAHMAACAHMYSCMHSASTRAAL